MKSDVRPPSRPVDFFEVCPEMACVVGFDGLIQAANPSLCAAFGYQRGELECKTFLELIHDDDRKGMKQALERGASDGGPSVVVGRFRSREGSFLPVGWRSRTSQASRAHYLLGTDQSGQKGMEAALKESQETVLALFENAAQGILTVDASGRIRSFNAMAEKLFGYARAEVVGCGLEILMPENLSQVHARHRREYFESPRSRPMGLGMDLVARRKDGSEFPVEISLSHISSAEGTIAVAFVNDVSERKRSEIERKRLEHQLEHAIKMEAVGRLAGGIAHDFNNLLTALSGFAEIVLDELPEDHPLREGAKETLKTCQRSTSLVRRLLALSRRQVQQLEVMDLNPKIAEIEKMLRSVLGEDVELVVKLQAGLGFVRADESQIEQVILNLVVNARDAMPQGGRLVIQTANFELDETMEHLHLGIKPGPYVLISVSDTGTGMEPETLEHIFEPFYTTKERGKGTGLGLATVYGIVNQSGGSITAYSDPGRGSTFKIYLPRVSRVGKPEPAMASSPRPSDGSETVLVVEDENTVRMMTVAILRKAGYDILEARDGEEALRIAESHPGTIHLVLTDVLMPGIHGPAMVKRLLTRLPAVRTLYMSGHADDALLHHGVLEAGFAFLEKPYSRDELTRKVREVLDAR